MLTSFSRRFKLEAVKRARRSTLTPTDWLNAALKALERGGLDAVRVVALSEALGASRGSFYWHFRDRADLLGRMLEHWEAEITDRVLAATHAAGGSAEERFHVLLEDVLERRRGRYELAIRAWAMHDRKAAATVRRCDRKRLDFVAGLFREMGFSAAESRARARLTLAYLEGDHIVLVREAPADRRRFLELRHRLLTSR
jgi:AcrR family transcriptional regulator